MKLRARKKSFSSKIKQEDHKPNLINAQSSTTEVANTGTFDLTIKQEDSKDHKVLLEQHGKFGSKDYYYCCDICGQRFPNLKSVLDHRKSNQIIRLSRSTTMAKNLDKEPDLYNPDFYCESCEKGYSNQRAYRSSNTKTDITPDPNDPNFYCRACNVTYKHKKTYKDHCRYAHGLKPAIFANQASSSGSLTDSYCQTCDKRLSTIASYRKHLHDVHKVYIKQIQQKRSDILPNVNDPDFYCRSCKKKMKSKKAFAQHLQLIHCIFKSAPRQSKLKPDVDDPNNYCRAC
ncbi:C2H2-type zinc finger transcription factor [Mucor lusitanicus]